MHPQITKTIPEQFRDDRTRFGYKVRVLARAGHKNPIMGAALAEPAAYNEWMEHREDAEEPEEETHATHDDGLMHGELRNLERLAPTDRPKGILAFAKRSPREYSEARRRNLI